MGGLVGLSAAVLTRLPFLPAEVEWLHSARHPVVMATGKARRELGWLPEYSARETLNQMDDAVGV